MAEYIAKNKKPIISDEHLTDEIFKLLSSGKSGKSDMKSEIRSRFRLGSDRFGQIYDVALSKWSTLKQNAHAVAIAADASGAAQTALKSKSDHQSEIEREIETIREMIALGYIVKRVQFPDGSTVDKKEIFGAREIALLNNSIDSKRAELFKLDGMYKPTKNILGGDPDNPFVTKIHDDMDLTKLSFDELLVLKSLQEKCLINAPNTNEPQPK